MRKQPATREPIEGALHDMVNGFLAARRATAWIEWEDDPATPGRRAYRITGESKDAVQAAITARMNYVEEVGGQGNFLGPYREGDGYIAIGETIVDQVTA